MDTATTAFEQHRPLLFGIAYRMLGSAMEAEDILQEAYLRFSAAVAEEEIRSERAYLSAIVTRLCLDHLKSAAVQREEYIGPWLPEPLRTAQTPEHIAGDTESLSMAFLVLLESLTPVERAVFLLREVFDYEYGDIARWVDKTETACRQIFSRAKKHITDNRPRFTPSPGEQAQIFSAFMDACYSGDFDRLKAVLTADVSAWSDGGGKASAAIRPLYGADVVARFVLGLFRRAPSDVTYEVGEINGSLALIIRDAAGVVQVVLVPELADGHIRALRFIRNPDKLRRI